MCCLLFYWDHEYCLLGVMPCDQHMVMPEIVKLTHMVKDTRNSSVTNVMIYITYVYVYDYLKAIIDLYIDYISEVVVERAY